jgi:hypothetical protein
MKREGSVIVALLTAASLVHAEPVTLLDGKLKIDTSKNRKDEG